MIATTQNVIDNLLAKVRELAHTSPDNVYRPAATAADSSNTKCTYLGGTCTDGTVGCLVGQALIGIGVTAERLREVDDLSIAEALENLLPTELSDADYDRVRWLESVQNAQDGGEPWHTAIETADREEPQ